MRALHVLLLSLFLGALLPATAEDGDGYKLGQVNWGEAIDGASRSEVKPGELAGKVVIVEEFGVQTPACIERLKDLGRLHKKLGRENANVAIIAIHRQRQVPDPTVVEAVTKERAEAIVIRKNGFLPASIGGMPHAAIFRTDGTMMWHGDSTTREFDKKLKEALEDAAASKP